MSVIYPDPIKILNSSGIEVDYYDATGLTSTDCIVVLADPLNLHACIKVGTGRQHSNCRQFFYGGEEVCIEELRTKMIWSWQVRTDRSVQHSNVYPEGQIVALYGTEEQAQKHAASI